MMPNAYTSAAALILPARRISGDMYAIVPTVRVERCVWLLVSARLSPKSVTCAGVQCKLLDTLDVV